VNCNKFERFPLSKSGREVFETCNKKWYYKYRLKIPKTPSKPDARAFGICIHRVLENMNGRATWDFKELLALGIAPGEDLVAQRETPEGKVLLDKLEKILEGGFRETVFEAIKHTQDSLLENDKEVWEVDDHLEARLIAHAFWMLHHLSLRPTKLVGAELKINMEDWLSGYIDSIETEDDGSWFESDYKFLASAPPPDSLIFDTQIRLYEYARDYVAEKLNLDPSKYKGFLYTVCTKRLLKPASATAKKPRESYDMFLWRCLPQIETFFVCHNKRVAEEVAEGHKKLHGHIMGLEEAEDFPRNRTACKGKYGLCEFHSLCNSDEQQLVYSFNNENLHLFKQYTTNMSKVVGEVSITVDIDL